MNPTTLEGLINTSDISDLSEPSDSWRPEVPHSHVTNEDLKLPSLESSKYSQKNSRMKDEKLLQRGRENRFSARTKQEFFRSITPRFDDPRINREKENQLCASEHWRPNTVLSARQSLNQTNDRNKLKKRKDLTENKFIDPGRPYSALNNDISHKLDRLTKKYKHIDSVEKNEPLEPQNKFEEQYESPLSHRDLNFLLPQSFVYQQAKDSRKKDKNGTNIDSLLKQVLDSGNKTNSESPQEWHIKNFRKPLPSGRMDAIRLEKWLYSWNKALAEKCVQEIEKENRNAHIDFISDSMELFSICVHEIIRQNSVECVERGRTLGTIWVRLTEMLEALISQFKKERNYYFSNIDSIKDELDFTRENYFKTLQQLRETMERSHTKISELEKNSAEKDKEINQLQYTITNLKQRVGSLQSDKVNLLLNNSNYNQEKSDFEIKINSLEMEKDRLIENVNQKQINVHQLEKKNEWLEQKVDQLKNCLIETRSQMLSKQQHRKSQFIQTINSCE